MEGTTANALAAIIATGETPTGALLETVARTLAGEGIVVGGVLQAPQIAIEGRAAPIVFVDVESGARTEVSQNLGPLSHACRLDLDAVARVTAALESRIEAGLDLMVINRFGKAEIEGRGLRAAFERAFLAGIPILTVVQPEQRAGWKDFHGGLADDLPADAGPVLAWCRRLVAARRG